MSSGTTNPEEEAARAEALPQADASSLVDAARLETEVKEMYRQVAREEEAGLHFQVGRPLAARLGYPAEVLVHGGQPYLIRERDRPEDVLRGQRLHQGLAATHAGIATMTTEGSARDGQHDH